MVETMWCGLGWTDWGATVYHAMIKILICPKNQGLEGVQEDRKKADANLTRDLEEINDDSTKPVVKVD